MSEDDPTRRVIVERERNPDDAPTARGPGDSQRVFGRYALHAVVGRGGMGVVWRAYDEKLEREVALKFLPDDVRTDPDAVRELKQETRRCLDLTHANIVRVYDFVEDGTMAAIAMEYVDGSSVAAWKAAKPHGCVNIQELSPLVAQLCSALQYAHATARIVHRDLKPANLLVTRDGMLKISDFGIARSLIETKTRLTGAEATSGTPAYMSPQQLLGQRPEPADDVYSLGATLYELLTSKPPFHAGSIATQIREVLPPRLNERRHELGINDPPVPAAWEETILACLAKKAGDRPSSAAEVAERLGLAPAPSVVRRSLKPGVWALTPARKRMLKIIGGAALLALIAAGYYFGIHAPAQRRQAELALREEQNRNAGDAERQRLEAEAAQLRSQKEKAEAALAQAKAEQDQRDHAAILARIEATPDSAPPAGIAATDKAVRDYLATAPEHSKPDVSAAWAGRQAACAAYQAASALGGLVVRTTPGAADVQVGTLAAGKSPLTLKDLKPGRYPVRIRLGGYEDWSGQVEIKQGSIDDLNVPPLVRSHGQFVLETEPAGLEYRLRGADDVVRSGRAGPQPRDLPTGRYLLTVSRRGCIDVTKYVEVNRNATTVEKVAVGSVVSGTWTWQAPGQRGGLGGEITLTLHNETGRITGSVSGPSRVGAGDLVLGNLSYDNDRLTFSLIRDVQGFQVVNRYSGRLDGDVIRGSVDTSGRGGQTVHREWQATRVR